MYVCMYGSCYLQVRSKKKDYSNLFTTHFHLKRDYYEAQFFLRKKKCHKITMIFLFVIRKIHVIIVF